MNQTAKQQLMAEAEGIMYAGGFIEARVEHFGPWWRVYGKLPGDNEHSGTTDKQADPQDPREMARRLVGMLKREEPAAVAEPVASALEEIPEAAPTEEPLFPDGEGPFDPPREEEDTPQDETHGETGASEALEDAASGAGVASGEVGDEQPESDVESGAGGQGLADGLDELEPDDAPIDAEFWAEELNRDPQPLEADDLADLPQLEGLEPVDEEADTEDSDADASKYIFGDNLANDRLFRQGQITDKAELLIEQVTATVDGGDSDFADLQAYVVSNLNAAGAFVGQDQDKYRRFVELSDAKNRVAKIQQARAEKISFIRTAEREAVATFDPEADWPLF